MGLLRSCVTCLTLLLWRNWVHSTVLCPSGDTPGIVKNVQNCSQLISSDNKECYNATIETNCCASCNDIATGISGCQYGNRVLQCDLGACPFYPNPNDCCFTCRTTTTIEIITTTMTPSPAGNTTSSPSQSPSAPTTTTPSSAGNSTTSSSSRSSSTATTTTVSSPAEDNITSVASQLSSSQSTSAGVIAGSIVGSLAGTGLIAGVTYAGVQFFKSTKLRRVDIA